MEAFDSIKMGHRCKSWSSQPDVPSAPINVISRGTSVQGRQWILNAATGERRKEVKKGSAVVLDGGPRWVFSTALGFLSGGQWLTTVYTALFVLVNYALYASTVGARWRFGDEASGILAYTILAAALSVASVPCVSFDGVGVSGWGGFASGLVVEVFLCICVIVSAAILHSFFGPSVAQLPGLPPYAVACRWSAPALVWMAASRLRDEAIQEAKKRLASWWCSHPMGMCSTSVPINILWDDWAVDVEECARRVGSYSMLGFSASDLDILYASTPSLRAMEVIKKLDSSSRDGGRVTEPWVTQSLVFTAGYDSRLRNLGPVSNGAVIPLGEIQRVIRSLKRRAPHGPEIGLYRKKIEGHHLQWSHAGSTEENEDWWFYAGAFMADSDQRAGSVAALGQYGSRLAVSLALLVEGTDPLARLTCYTDMLGSSVSSLSSALSLSTEALVSELARSAGVTGSSQGLGDGLRGLAYATGNPKSLAYAPDEIVAASHLQETIVISDDTFSAGSDTFETLWRGSETLEKRVEVSDMVPLAASASEAGTSAFLGWVCHMGFTLAVLTVYLSDSSYTAFIVLLLVVIPAKDKKVSAHMNDHYYMIYVSFVLNYVRPISRWASLSPRGKAAIDKAQSMAKIVFLFVNILPVLACYVFSGRYWWFTFIPCILANSPGLLNTIVYGWASAFKYEWWSWHIPNRWFSGRSYLGVVALRKRVGRNVLSVNPHSRMLVVAHVQPSGGALSLIQERFMVVGV